MEILASTPSNPGECSSPAIDPVKVTDTCCDELKLKVAEYCELPLQVVGRPGLVSPLPWPAAAMDTSTPPADVSVNDWSAAPEPTVTESDQDDAPAGDDLLVGPFGIQLAPIEPVWIAIDAAKARGLGITSAIRSSKPAVKSERVFMITSPHTKSPALAGEKPPRCLYAVQSNGAHPLNGDTFVALTVVLAHALPSR
jgi:hypothetical protein